MTDLSRQLQLIAEPFDDLFIRNNLWSDDLKGDFFIYFRIDGLINPSHTAFSQPFDDLEAAGEGGAVSKVLFGRFNSFGDVRFFGIKKFGAAFLAERGFVGIFMLAFRA